MTAAAGLISYAKTHTTEDTEDSIADQDSIPPPSPGTVNPPLHLATSPASIESLLGRMNTGLPSTPMLDPHTGLLLAVSEAHEASSTPTDFLSMMEALAQKH